MQGRAVHVNKRSGSGRPGPQSRRVNVAGVALGGCERGPEVGLCLMAPLGERLPP